MANEAIPAYLRQLKVSNDNLNGLPEDTWAATREKMTLLLQPPWALLLDEVWQGFDVSTRKELFWTSHLVHHDLPERQAQTRNTTLFLFAVLLQEFRLRSLDNTQLSPTCCLLLLSACNLLCIHMSILRRVTRFTERVNEDLFPTLVGAACSHHDDDDDDDDDDELRATSNSRSMSCVPFLIRQIGSAADDFSSFVDLQDSFNESAYEAFRDIRVLDP